ncbi:MAG: autotransporter-associated beta strand repeat-containing protein, partial [Verrucomicrobiota bacterium]
TFAGAIIGAGGGINKLGASTLTLSGNSYSGTTTVSAGTLNLTGSLASAITVNSGASISGNGDGTTTGVTTDLLTMNGGSFIKLAGGATTTSLTANGVNFAGATNLLFSTPLVNGNTYDVVSYGAGPLTDLSNLNGSAYRGGFTDTGTKITMTANFGTRTWNAIANTGYWEIDTDPNFDEGDQKFFNGDSVIFGDIASDATITLIGRLAPASVVVSNNNASTYTFSGTTGTHDITGNSSLTKSGAGTLTINSAHTYSGGTTIDGGTIKLETGATPGTGAITINNTGKLSINDQGVLNSAAAVTVNAGGTFEILGTAAGQDFSGTVILNGGKLLNNDWAFSYKPIVLNAGDQTVEVIGNTFHLFGGNGKFTGTGNLIKEGAGTLATWSSAGTSDFTGTTTVNAGTLSLVAGAGGFSATSAVTIAAGATVDIKTNERLNDAASVTANGNFKLSGAVTETIASLNGASTGQVFNGTTSTAATLVVGANNATGSFAGTIVNGTGAMALTKIGTGTQTLSGTNTYTGTTTVTAGTLSLATASLADTSTVSISTGATLDLPHGTTDNIVALVINGTPKADGLYKAVGAAGLGTELAELTGTGKLLVTPANTFATWMGGFSFAAFPGANLTANGDTDGDGIKNLLEQVFGTAPNAATTGLTQVGGTASSLTFKHPLNASLASDVTYSYQWSSNLAEWRSSGQANTGGTTATIVAGAPVAGEVTVTTTISAGPAIKVFVRVVANQAP